MSVKKNEGKVEFDVDGVTDHQIVSRQRNTGA
jgi:hypothetical protein